MTMVKKAGTTLQTGATASPVSGTHTQTSGRNSAGELEIIHDETGKDISVYVKDPHKEISFEAVLEATVTDKEIGDIVTVTTGTGGDATTTKYIVTQWNVTESNDDVKKVSIGLRTTDLEETQQSS